MITSPVFWKTDVFKCSRCLSLCLNVIMSDSVDSSVCCQRQLQQVVCVFAASLVESVGLSSFSISQSYYWSHSLLSCVLYQWAVFGVTVRLQSALKRHYLLHCLKDSLQQVVKQNLVFLPSSSCWISSQSHSCLLHRLWFREGGESNNTSYSLPPLTAGCVHHYFTSVCRVSHLESEVRVDPCQQDVTWYHRLWWSRTHLTQLISIYGSVLLFLCTFWICTSQNFTRSSSRN